MSLHSTCDLLQAETKSFAAGGRAAIEDKAELWFEKEIQTLTLVFGPAYHPEYRAMADGVVAVLFLF